MSLKKKRGTIEIDLRLTPFWKRALLVLPLLALIFWGVYASKGATDLSESSSHEGHAAGSSEHFEYLSQQRTNSCGLQRQTVMGMSDDQRIQGSCCSQMDLHAYQEQVEALKKYKEISVIPPDPYDISASQAKKLFTFLEEITLNSDQQKIYNEAAALSDEGGPCCCKCWHWDAYEGLAKFLISERDWGAEQIAELWDISDACGGASHAHGAG